MSGNINSKKRVWLLALVLAINVAITTIAVVNILNSFRLDSSGAIELVNDGAVEDPNEDEVVASMDEKKPSKDSDIVVDKDDEVFIDEIVNDMAIKPGFEASDDELLWETETNVNIFKVSYVNDESVVTVKSDNGSKVIAPGTENSYSFKFKNTGNTAIEYTLDVDVFITGTDVVFPVEGRIRRFDGDWLIGSNTEFVNVLKLDSIKDTYKLDKGRYSYYTLDWKWPFEGDDYLDTYLGNLASEEDLTLTIKLKTVAEATDTGGGIIDTGDDSSSTVWAIAAGLSFVLFFVLLFARRDDEEEEAKV